MYSDENEYVWDAVLAATRHLVTSIYEDEYILPRVYERVMKLLFLVVYKHFASVTDFQGERLEEFVQRLIESRFYDDGVHLRQDLDFAQKMTECRRCNQLCVRRDLVREKLIFPELELTDGPIVYQICRTCVKKCAYELTGFLYVCEGCGVRYKLATKEYLSYNFISSALHKRFCARCSLFDEIIKRVDTHLERARKADLPATLTLHEWFAALTYFNRSCAYCGRPYEVMEHYVPIQCGGGTTVTNIVPACLSCNSRKRDLPPEYFKYFFPFERIERIQHYFSSR